MTRSHMGIRREKRTDSAAEAQNPPESQAATGIAPRPISAARKRFPLPAENSPQANRNATRKFYSVLANRPISSRVPRGAEKPPYTLNKGWHWFVVH